VYIPIPKEQNRKKQGGMRCSQLQCTEIGSDEAGVTNEMSRVLEISHFFTRDAGSENLLSLKSVFELHNSAYIFYYVQFL
jgi:hypothetical protein